MGGGAAPRAESGLYVYGVVRGDTPPDLFAGVRGVDPSQRVELVAEGEVAAVASAVSMDEFGADAIAENLRVADWVAAKVRAHDDVLAAAVGRTAVVPFRFGAIYQGVEPVRAMLRERSDLGDRLDHLAGRVELGVKGYLDRDRVRALLAAERGLGDDEPETGRAYMERRRLDRELDEEIRARAAEWSADSHERLAAAADDARFGPPRQDEAAPSGSQMFLNGAYLVTKDAAERFRAALAELEAARREDGVSYEVTGPWPPYSFVADEEEEPQ
jgi:hypothetical protein